jgi:hypothetical protein
MCEASLLTPFAVCSGRVDLTTLYYILPNAVTPPIRDPPSLLVTMSANAYHVV